jgi:hypothetical protein
MKGNIKMKHLVQGLLTLLISLFILNSCKNPDDIGLDIAPGEEINSLFIDTVTVRSTTVREDTFSTIGLSQHPLGYLQDPVIGTTESSLALALSMPLAGTVHFPKTAVLDSAVLVLNFGKEFYGSNTVPFIINVYQLNEKFNPTSGYSSNKTWNYNPTVIGSKVVGAFNLKDSLKITDIVTGKADTQKTVPPQLRIPISSSFINSNFLKADSLRFTDNTRFNNFIKGLYISVDRSNNPSGIVFFNLSSTTASNQLNGLDVYYKSTSGTITDTIVNHFGITTDSTAASIKRTYTAAVQTQLNNPQQSFSTVYVQPGGLRTKINFPFLNSLKNKLGKVIINKAELVIPLDANSNILYGPAPRLILYRTDIADQRQPVPDNNTGQGQSAPDPRVIPEPIVFGGFYDAVNKRYKFVITSYIQDILSGKLTQYDTYLAPIYTNEQPSRLISAQATGSTVARSVLGGGSNSTNKMKLNIIYTRLQ